LVRLLRDDRGGGDGADEVRALGVDRLELLGGRERVAARGALHLSRRAPRRVAGADRIGVVAQPVADPPRIAATIAEEQSHSLLRLAGEDPGGALHGTAAA